MNINKKKIVVCEVRGIMEEIADLTIHTKRCELGTDNLEKVTRKYISDIREILDYMEKKMDDVKDEEEADEF